jgi:hypothetical protein
MKSGSPALFHRPTLKSGGDACRFAPLFGEIVYSVFT